MSDSNIKADSEYRKRENVNPHKTGSSSSLKHNHVETEALGTLAP